MTNLCSLAEESTSHLGDDGVGGVGEESFSIGRGSNVIILEYQDRVTKHKIFS